MSRSLVVLAAGLGRRFGGTKQLVSVGPSGESLFEYTIHDALAAGFDRVVLVVRRDLMSEVLEHASERYGRRVEVAFACQSLAALPGGRQPTTGRTRPWGTGHALLCAREFLDGGFAVVNADDHYGPESLAALGGFLSEGHEALHAMVGFRLGDTLSPHGSVSRAVCTLDDEGFLARADEATGILRREDGSIVDSEGCSEPAAGPGSRPPLAEDTPVSLNCWAFAPSILEVLAADFEAFLGEEGDSLEAEFGLPQAVDAHVRRAELRVRVLQTRSRWFGMTGPDDRQLVEQALRDRVAAGAYPAELWA